MYKYLFYTQPAYLFLMKKLYAMNDYIAHIYKCTYEKI
jgi:hypothetical protein